MTVMGWLEIISILVAVVAAAIPLGTYIARVMGGERTFMSPVLVPIERGFYALSGVDPKREQGWRAYTLAMLAFRAYSAFTRCSACRPICRSTPRVSTVWRPTSPSTRP